MIDLNVRCSRLTSIGHGEQHWLIVLERKVLILELTGQLCASSLELWLVDRPSRRKLILHPFHYLV